jgi:hypothetical protein
MSINSHTRCGDIMAFPPPFHGSGSNQRAMSGGRFPFEVQQAQQWIDVCQQWRTTSGTRVGISLRDG